MFLLYYIKQHLNTQLKTVGESVSVVSKLEETLKEIDNIGTVGMPRMAQANRLLKETFADCSIEAIKMAIAQSTLNEDQIELVLSSKGLTGNILETTTAELANATATNAMAAVEGAATTATVGFDTAIKGLGASLKSLAAAHPVLLAIVATIGAIYATVKIIDACTTSFDELKNKISDLKQEVSDSESTLKNYKTQLDEINQKITEINNQDSLSFTDKQELENLKNQKTELENMYNIEKARHDLKQKELEDTANEYFNKKFDSDYATESYTQKQMKNGQFVDVSYTKAKKVTKLEEMEAAYNTMVAKQKELNNLEEKYNQSSNHTDKDTKEYEKKKTELEKDRDDAKKTALDIQEEAKQQVQGLDSTSDTYKKVTEASQELSDALARLNNDWDNLSDKGKREDLSSTISKEAKNLSSGGMKDINNYLSTLSGDDLNILKNVKFDENTTVESLKEAIKKAQEEADKNPVEQKVTFDPTDLYRDSMDKDRKDSSINLADLKDRADVLKSIKDDLSETGKISVDVQQKISKIFPEAKEALGEFVLGLIDEQQLFEELQTIYEDDTNAYAQKIYKQMELSEEFLNKVKGEYPEFFEFLNTLYGEDLGNYTNLAELKKRIDETLIQELDRLWANHYSLVYDEISGLYSLSMDDQALLDGSISESEADKILSEAGDAVDKANSVLEKIRDIRDSYQGQITSDNSWETIGKDSSSKSSSSAKDKAKDINFVERAVKKLQNAYTRLKNVVSDTTRSWSTRNNALIQSQQELTRQINLQSQAYEYYMQLFNALDLDDYYKKLIMDGAILVETITDPDLLEVINKAIELFDKAEEAKNNISSMTAELHELSTQLFDNTAKEFQGKINVYEHAMKTLENGVSLIETKGYKVTASLYEEMIAETQDRISLLEQERSALESAMASADVEVGSEAWMDMYNQILDVDNAIQEANISLAEFNNELRQLKWDKFDDIQSGIQETIDEAEFMYKLLENRGLTNDTGGLNDNGMAAQGLLAEKYNLYMAMADKYAKEVKAIDAELANDPGNTKLLERRQELLKAQREAILNAEDEKESIKDLIEESYNKLGDTISDLISKYKDFIKTIRDTYNYEKQMADKTKELADLQKQYVAVKGDNSEEGMSRQQQLEDQIKDKQDDIQQTEYEKLISDTEALLDKFNSEYQEWLTNLVTELETTLQMAIDQTNQYSDQILTTLNDQAYGVGYTLSEATTAVFSSIGDSVAMYGQGFLDSANGINSSIMLVENAVEAVYNAVQAQAIAQQAIAQAQAQIAGAMMGGGSSGSQSAGGDALSGQNDTGSGGGNSIGVGSIMTLKDGSSYWETSWGNGRSGSKYAGVQGGVIIDEMSIAGLVDGGENDPNAYGDHYVHIRSADGVYRDLGWVRWEDLEQYASGTNHAKGDWAWTQEKGSEIIRTSDGAILTPVGKGGMVFNNESSKNLYELSQDPISYFKDNMSAINPMINVDKYIPTPLTNNSKNGDVNMGGVNFSIGQIVADNPQEFVNQLKQVMASDAKVQKMVQEITLGQSLGNNSLNARRYL